MPGSRFCVAALNALQNSIMLSPRWPSAGPIGGDGLALPAGTCSLIKPTIFFAMFHSLRLQTLRLASAPRGLAAQSFNLAREPDACEASGLLDLRELQLHGRGATEDRHRHAD